jgi:hypothetical protein
MEATKHLTEEDATIVVQFALLHYDKAFALGSHDQIPPLPGTEWGELGMKRSQFNELCWMAYEQGLSGQEYEYYLSLTHSVFTESTSFAFGLNKKEADSIKTLMTGFKSKTKELETQLKTISRDSETINSATLKAITDLLEFRRSKERVNQ